MLKKIVVALDHSDWGEQVFDQALNLAKANQSQLMLVHVLTPHEEGNPIGPLLVGFTTPDEITTYLEQLDAFKAKGLELLRSHANIAQQQGIDAEYQQSFGDAGSTLCDVARTWEADVIVMGRRSRTLMSKLFLGSVSNYVTHHAPCSVFIVHL